MDASQIKVKVVFPDIVSMVPKRVSLYYLLWLLGKIKLKNQLLHLNPVKELVISKVSKHKDPLRFLYNIAFKAILFVISHLQFQPEK